MTFTKVLMRTTQEKNVIIVFDDTIADIISNKKINPIVTKVLIRGKKLNISLVFITQSYFKLPKDIRPISKHYFIMKIPPKRKLQQIAINHSSDIDFTKILRKKYCRNIFFFGY